MKNAEMTLALTVAGFDGSAGAGILADIKAMAFFGVYGQAVCTAATVQNEDNFVAPNWLDWESIESQLETLAAVRQFKAVKIGLVENVDILKKIIRKIRELFPKAFLVWDPILASTSGFRFFKNSGDAQEFLKVLPQVDLITPNQNEFNFLGLGLAACRDEVHIGKDFSVLLKGGHAVGSECADILFHDGERFRFVSPRIQGEGKHGTGCTLSAAIVANLALGKSLPESCAMAKKYMDLYLTSGNGKLAFPQKFA